MEYSNMIDEVTFSTRFSALWSVLTPSMEHFVRSANLDLYERYEAPISAGTEPDVRAVLSEAAFVAVNRSLHTSQPAREYAKTHAEELIEAGYNRVAHLRGSDRLETPISNTIKQELGQLGDSISKYLRSLPDFKMLAPEPSFRGCGYLSPCSGDYSCSCTYIEMKNVERNFRATDFRQILTYLFLDWATGQGSYDCWVLLNARKGIFVEGSVEQIADGCAGKSADMLFEEILYNVTSGDLSR
jgi:hypothetical protein